MPDNQLGSPVNEPPGSTNNENSLFTGHRLGLVPDQGLPRLKMPFTARASSIVIPASADHIRAVPAWNMGGNDKYGTCGPTSFANYCTMVYWNLLGEAVTVTDDAVFALYRAAGNPDFNPVTDEDDNGVDMVTLLNAAMDVGIEITHDSGATEQVKVVGFGQLGSDMPSIQNSTAVFGGSIMAVTLDTAQQSQTANGVWDYSPSDVWGGHAIMGASYTGDPSGADEEIISWQEPIGLTDSFVSHQLQSAFAVILPLHLTHPAFLAGVNIEQLAADFQDLTGRPFPSV